MGRSTTTSCFKIITCGNDSVDRDDLQVSESKGSTDKRGWSFRKRSARHRVLSNTVISEVPSSVNKGSSESANVDFQTQPKSAPPEKSSVTQWIDEKPQFPTSVNSKFSEPVAVAEEPQFSTSKKFAEHLAVSEADTKFDSKPDESVVIIIQAAIRRFLAERELLKQKYIVKLQAVVRGHLVRRYAVGSLRCVQAIIKMQGLVRARHSCLSAVKNGTDDHVPKLQEKQKLGANPDIAYESIEKLVSNRFARQLLESTPKTKSLNIKCDASSSDSAWKWLERWVVSPTRIDPLHKSEPCKELQEQDKVKKTENQVETTLIPDDKDFESTETTLKAVPLFEPEAEEAVVPSESEKLLETYKSEQLQMENLDLLKSSENLHQPLTQYREPEPFPQLKLNSFSGKPEPESEHPKRSMKRVASEQPETEGRKFVFGSRKSSNTAFIAAQSKFEELASTDSTTSVSLTNQENEVESCTHSVSSAISNPTKTNEIELAENSVLPTSSFQVGGSECGTELSISSTLDSPDQSEVGAVEIEQEADVSEDGPNNPKDTSCIKVDATIPLSDLSHSSTVQQEKQDCDNGDTEAKVTIPSADSSCLIAVQSEKQDSDKIADDESFENEIPADSSKVEKKLEDNLADNQIELENRKVDQIFKTSPAASPRSHITVQDSQDTPSSQVSTKSKKNKSEKNGSNPKRKSLSAAKKSPTDANNDSGLRSSLELPKDPKSGKRRNSFGSAKSDHVDHEPRDSSSSHSIPSYMQATESARAKACANISPRSSPDAQDKEIYMKKRHSLPGANGRQGSPRIQRSMSQAQQSSKANGTNSPHERKWQR